MGRGRDMFRARKQNTSRPPSMHVDDFMNFNQRVSGRAESEWAGPIALNSMPNIHFLILLLYM